MRLRAAFALLPAALLLAGCSGDDSADTPPPTSTSASAPATTPTETTPKRNVGEGVYEPTDEVVSETYGIATRITDVSPIDTRYGPGVVITFDLRNDSDEIFQDYNWPTPSLSTGERGVPAEQIFSGEDNLPQGVSGNIPPGASRVVRHGFEVSMEDMTDATLSVGSIIWRGDFTTVGESSRTSGGGQAPAVTTTATVEQTQQSTGSQSQPAMSPPVGFTGAPNGDPQPLVGKTIDYCMDGDMYQTGTTQFTDGTTGWTQECAGQ
ncbi:hypothetical protein KUG88_28335 [Rhodococcus rhodochrous]|uniref:hypothetical protein n=1 Tax=Rhodococcus rhodochrous TaxID=1829 RepID=UPI001E3E442F|nr:hypothetical protein [Rhodococcus rhodochrous]MCB8914012.1 hypothetical protein [Rhodococcus rhodochrous]